MTDTADTTETTADAIRAERAAEPFGSRTGPVEDWTTDFDIFNEDYVVDPVPVWNDLRDECPMARSERWGGAWMPTRYDDIQALAKMVPDLSSMDPLVVTIPEELAVPNPEGFSAAPISADPPEATWTRRMILPAFAPKAVMKYKPYTEQLCHELIDGFIERGEADAAGEYAQQIPPRVIAHMLGFEENKADDFVVWVRGLLENGLTNPASRKMYRDQLMGFLKEEILARWEEPRDDLVSELVHMGVPEMEGREVPVVMGIVNLLVIAGIDTTWSSIGSAIFHFGTHADDRQRLAADHGLFPTAIEEMLRYYSPVTMGRIAATDVEFNGCPIKQGDKVLMNFPGANHDPAAFENPEQIQIDRARNRHIAFGSGIHRCAGSNLARLEMDVALRVWFERIPEFEVADSNQVTWAGGQVRGPRHLPVRF